MTNDTTHCGEKRGEYHHQGNPALSLTHTIALSVIPIHLAEALSAEDAVHRSALRCPTNKQLDVLWRDGAYAEYLPFRVREPSTANNRGVKLIILVPDA